MTPLTRHDYYRSPIPKFQKLRLQCTADVGRVVEALEKVAVLMDAEEVQRQRREAEERRRWQLAEEARRRAEEERRRVEEADRRKREAILARAEARRRAEEAGKEFDEVAFTEGANDGGEAALTDKLDLLNDLFPKTPSGVGADQKNSLLPLASSMSNMFVNQQEQALQSASHLPIRSDLPLPLPGTGASSELHGRDREKAYWGSGAPNSAAPTSIVFGCGSPDDGMEPPDAIEAGQQS